MKRKISTNNETFKVLRPDPYEFYLVILPLGIRWALMKYHINPSDMTKTQDFWQDFYVCDLLLYPLI